MKGKVASVLIIAALMIGAGIGYFGITNASPTVTEQNTTTVYQASGQFCIVTEYQIWSVEAIHNSTTVGGTSTQEYVATSFVTSGYPTYTTATYTGTLTGALAYWNGTTCYQIP